MLMKWFPWRFVLKHVTRAHGFMDPVAILSKLERFAQPSELIAPTELLRAGLVLQARGLINSQAIQHNLDWIWPFWVERQFNPLDDAFIPRAFNLTHINLTHRNWTALGIPGCEEFVLVDPRGLVTPFFDGWSLDAWIFSEKELILAPSQMPIVTQEWDLKTNPAIMTTSSRGSCRLVARTEVEEIEGNPVCRIRWTASTDQKALLVISLRPFNPEGVSFIDTVSILWGQSGWKINGKQTVYFNPEPSRHHFSHYRIGDVAWRIHEPAATESVECNVGLATAAAVFEINPSEDCLVEVKIPLAKHKEEEKLIFNAHSPASKKWEDSLRGHCVLEIPDKRFQVLYETALRTLILHSPGDVYPGPYTYKRFWFRDAAFIIHALLCAGLAQRAETALDKFSSRQTPFGYFLSQEGEWDSNGQALWIWRRFTELTGKAPKAEWQNAILKGADWIKRKRISETENGPHAGLLPPGFSAEHFGPNDYYYWDDFWAVAGLRAGAFLAEHFKKAQKTSEYLQEADRMMRSIESSLEAVSKVTGKKVIPASPYRRLDPAAIGSMTAGYPLRLWKADYKPLLETAEFLMSQCFVRGGFYQEISHSGINVYLTLHIAQVLLRASDPRFIHLLDALADLASPTGQWPEAIHPRTGGGCMGDGQHVWAAAEWLLMMRNCLVREEDDRLILGSGVTQAWLASGQVMRFGPAPTTYGTISIRIQAHGAKAVISWEAEWRAQEPTIEIRFSGRPGVIAERGKNQMEISI